MCVFCKIANHELDAKIVYEDKKYIAFYDINPKTPIHILIIPKKHIESFHTITKRTDKSLVKWLFDIAWKIIEQLNLTGCQLHMNSWRTHWQEVMHIHLHLLSRWTTKINW